MARLLPDRNWLAALVDEAIRSHDPSAVRARLPELSPPGGGPFDFAAAAAVLVARSLRTRPPDEPASEEEGFREEACGHLALLLDLRQLRAQPPADDRVRAELAAYLAAAVNEPELALEALDPAGATAPRARGVERALAVAGRRLRGRFFPPGDPRLGLPLHSGSVAVFRRHLARVVGGHVREGRLELEALWRHEEYAARELLLLAEALSGLVRTVSEPDRRTRWVRHQQMARLGLRGARLREARRVVAAPRPPEALAAQTPAPIRAFVFEQLLLAQLRAPVHGEAPTRLVEAFAQAAGLGPEAVMAAQVQAAAQSGDPQAWFEDFGGAGAALDWHGLADDWSSAAGQVVDRFSTAVAQNLGALATELRETGELGTLLTKAAAGQKLTAEEKRKVRAQLVDLAKAVPALAVFAAPGGAILLPILLKVLPFSLLPSAWENMGTGPGAGVGPGAGPVPGAGAPPARGGPGVQREPQGQAAAQPEAPGTEAPPPRKPGP